LVTASGWAETLEMKKRDRMNKRTVGPSPQLCTND
jgi:hypothetical protein